MHASEIAKSAGIRTFYRLGIVRRRRYSSEVIELCVRWYITYRLSYRDLVAMMAERRVAVSHTTILRWVLKYVPEYEHRWARFARPPARSWRMDETEVVLGALPHWLYRAVEMPRLTKVCTSSHATTRAGNRSKYAPTGISTT